MGTSAVILMKCAKCVSIACISARALILYGRIPRSQLRNLDMEKAIVIEVTLIELCLKINDLRYCECCFNYPISMAFRVHNIHAREG